MAPASLFHALILLSVLSGGEWFVPVVRLLHGEVSVEDAETMQDSSRKSCYLATDI